MFYHVPQPSLTVELLALPSHYTSLPPNPSQLNVANDLALEHEYTGGHRLIYSLCELIHKQTEALSLLRI